MTNSHISTSNKLTHTDQQQTQTYRSTTNSVLNSMFVLFSHGSTGEQTENKGHR